MANSIRVELLERSYDIEIGVGNLTAVGSFLQHRGGCSKAIVVTDSNVGPVYGSRVQQALADGGVRSDLLTVAAGEASKCVAVAERLWHEFASLQVDRRTVVLAVGGGVIGDLAGFAAATYARGLPFYQVPTTVLAQVDSSVGGKVGINLPAAKNIVGAFWQPRGVLIDLEVLVTLPDREYRSGLAEVVKYGVIMDSQFFEYLEQNVAGLNSRDPATLAHVIGTSCRLKAEVVRQDEREETGLRAILNYGHTFGHAIETVTGYGRYLHGEAVAIGMIYASRLAEQLGRVEAALTSRQRALLERLALPTSIAGLPADDILMAMQLDKKAENGRLRFVLPDRLGRVELVGGIDAATVKAVLVQPL